jgi:hypothetical protein
MLDRHAMMPLVHRYPTVCTLSMTFLNFDLDQ